MQSVSYLPIRGLKVGAIGGLVGSIFLGVLEVMGSVAMNQEVFYTTVARGLGFGSSAAIGGWVLHFLTGIITGAVFVAATSYLKMFSLNNVRKAVWVGILAGIPVWLILYVPVAAIWVPNYVYNPTFAGVSLILHSLYGVVTAVVSIMLIRRGTIVAKTA